MPKKSHQREASDSDSEQPEWDSTPIMMRKWALELPEYLEDIDANFVTWWSQGYTMVKTTACGPTKSHR